MDSTVVSSIPTKAAFLPGRGTSGLRVNRQLAGQAVQKSATYRAETDLLAAVTLGHVGGAYDGRSPILALSVSTSDRRRIATRQPVGFVSIEVPRTIGTLGYLRHDHALLGKQA